MSNSGINFKVYCISGDNTEVKRFFVDTDAVTSFVFMKEKLKSVFPNLTGGNFRITWKDAEGDHISVTNDDDFITALTEMNDNPKVLYVSAESRNFPEDNPRHFKVICDVCQKGISGYRYKCIECHDYDLCATCEGNGHHNEHMVLRLPNSSTPIAKIDRKMMYNAARALKKSAFTIAKDKCARDSSKGGEKDKSNRHESSTSAQNPGYGCPFTTTDMGEMLAQNISPFVEMFSKGASSRANEEDGVPPNPMSELVRSVAEAFNQLINPEAAATSTSGQTQHTAPQATPSPANEENQTPAQKKTENIESNSQKTPSSKQPSKPHAENATSGNGQDMEWTLVSDEETNSQASATTQPPPLPQDPRLMRGLAQLYEMGFSNENNFLNYMLEQHNYQVGDVVKAILEMK